MTAAGLRDMPVIEAFHVEALRGDHYRAAFPDGERTYPSKDAMRRAAARIGTAVIFRDSTRAAAAGESRLLPPAPGPEPHASATGPHPLEPRGRARSPEPSVLASPAET